MTLLARRVTSGIAQNRRACQRLREWIYSARHEHSIWRRQAMSGRMSRAQRQNAFLESANRMFNQLEDWYEEHPQASFAELESQARQGRRTLMGAALAVVING